MAKGQRLTILIPTLIKRQSLYNRLMMGLESQCITDGKIIANILSYEDDGAATTGFKRNCLIKECKTDYCVFIDDDDAIAHDYVDEILKALESKPDCVTFKGMMITNNNTREEFEMKLGNAYDEVQVNRTRKFYRRPPNHLCPVKTEIMRQHPFPDATWGEDFAQCKSMADAGAIKTSVHIDKVLYYYNYQPKKNY